MQRDQQNFAVLSGGVGGAKLVLGLAQFLPPQNLQVIANTGDDFEHLGLPVSPDIDTLIYTLAGLANPDTGWGRQDESWNFMAALEELGGASWFRLGDRDLAMHVRRRDLLAGGRSLSAATRELARGLGVQTAILPMSDAPIRTHVDTAEGELGFQDYFVRLQAQPAARAIRYRGADTADAATDALAALQRPGLSGIIIAPSNPWLSIAPILAATGLESALSDCPAPVTAVSPIVAGKAIKGPTAKLMQELGITAGVVGIAEYYKNIIDGLVIDTQDAEHRATIERMGISVAMTDTIMNDLADKTRLAEFVAGFTAELRAAS